MKRFALGVSSAFLAAALFSLTGCDSGGIDEGMPKEVTQPAVDVGKMGNMTKALGPATKNMPNLDVPKDAAPKDAAPTPEKK